MMMEVAAAGDDAQPLAVANDYAALPTDVLHDILLRLPANEVCRLRLVCRSWRSLTSDPLFAAAHTLRHPHVVIVGYREGSHNEAEVRAVDLYGNVIKRSRIRQHDGSLGRLSLQGDLVCVAHGWGLAYVVDIVTGAVVADVTAEHMRKVNTSKPHCMFGHVPSTGEYKVLRMQVDGQRTTFEIVTLGGGAGRWRQLPRPPIRLMPGSGNMAVVAGLAYFLVRPGPEHQHSVKADSIAVFDLETEEWKPAILQGPLSSRGRRSMNDDEDEYDEPTPVLRRRDFQLVRLGESLVTLYCNVEDCLTELWFLEDMEDDMDTTARWTRRYTLQCTPFVEDFFSSLLYYYPLAVLNDGKILVWVDDTTWTRSSALRAYDPETSAWTDLVTSTEGCVVGIHRGSLLCSNLGGD